MRTTTAPTPAVNPTTAAYHPADSNAPAPATADRGNPTAADPTADPFADVVAGFHYGSAADGAGYVIAPPAAAKITAADRAAATVTALGPDVRRWWGAVIGHADRMLAKGLLTGDRRFDVATASGRFLTYADRRQATAVAAVLNNSMVPGVARLLRCANLRAAAYKVADSTAYGIRFTAPAPPAPRVAVDPAALMTAAAARPAVVVNMAAAAAA